MVTRLLEVATRWLILVFFINLELVKHDFFFFFYLTVLNITQHLSPFSPSSSLFPVRLKYNCRTSEPIDHAALPSQDWWDGLGGKQLVNEIQGPICGHPTCTNCNGIPPCFGSNLISRTIIKEPNTIDAHYEQLSSSAKVCEDRAL